MHENKQGKKHYGHLTIMAVLSFFSMYILMYAMVDRSENVYPNCNQFYMAGLMTSPMIIIELLLMHFMYDNRKLNAFILIASALAGISFYTAIRYQAGISDKQFLKSMIPHHGAAILMCEKAPIYDLEVKKLCKNIISSQQSEIDEMKEIMAKLDY